ncbi:DNA polymerase III subunit gamma/tau [SAR86 cluster bacterium]|nr:DNA polymerase III subunit gamma/tau [SAR86 cluster bacterium]
MSYLVLARKWRPKSFTEVVGQDHIVQALKNSLKNDMPHQAFLFTGTRGVGKTSLARILTKALNCEHLKDGEPCNKCDSCLSINDGSSIDFQEIDAASRRGISETKELLETIPYLPSSSKFKVYLIDEVHMLTKESFNSLLKTLEEPPPHVIFMFATTEVSQIPATILSRCLQLNLNSVSNEDLMSQLANIFSKEKVKYEEGALQLISEAANGSIRDALTISEKIISFTEKDIRQASVRQILGIPDNEIIQEILINLKNNDPKKLFEVLENITKDTPIKNIFLEIMELIKNISLRQFSQNKKIDFNKELLELEPRSLQIFYQLCLVNLEYIEESPDPKGVLEMTLLKMLAFDIEEKKNLTINQNYSVNLNWPELINKLNLNKVFTQHLMHTNAILKGKDFVISLPNEREEMIGEDNKFTLEAKLRDYFSIHDLKVKFNSDYDDSISPSKINEEIKKKESEIVESRISESDSYKKIVNELNPEIKKFDTNS